MFKIFYPYEIKHVFQKTFGVLEFIPHINKGTDQYQKPEKALENRCDCKTDYADRQIIRLEP